MNQDVLKGKWMQLKGEARTQWGRLTNDDLDQIQGNSEKLIGKLQERYGYAKEKAQDEYDRWVKLQSTETLTP